LRFACWAYLAAVAGCDSRPAAPALQNDPIYRNKKEHFRLLAPEGWIQTARQELPAGHIDKERLLVQYTRSSDRPATFEVSCADLPESTDLVAFMEGPGYGSTRWRKNGPADKIEIGGLAGTRLALSARIDGEDKTREVAAFRRGGRVYFFTGLYAASDTAARDQVRRAIDGIIWSD
jgi:hypothetical protein